MKKFVFLFTAIAAMAFASCGFNTPKEEAEEVVIDETELVDSTVVDSLLQTVDSVVAE